MLFERTVRQRRIPWIQLDIPGCTANLATATPLMHSSMRRSRKWRRAALGPTSRREEEEEGTLSMWVFLSARLRTWLLLAIALPLARLLVHRLAVAAERHDPSARTAKLLRRADSAVTAVSGRSSRRVRR
jgi:hypothetical protein